MRAKAWAVCQIVHFPNGNLNAFLSNNSRGMSESEGNVPHTIPIGDAGCSRRFGAVRKSLSYERSLSKQGRKGVRTKERSTLDIRSSG